MSGLDKHLSSNYPRNEEDEKTRVHRPIVAFLLTLFLPFLPGAASFYNRQFGKGIVYLVIGTSCLFLTLETLKSNPNGYFAGGDLLGALCLYLFYALDSIFIARTLGRGQPVSAWEMF